MRLGLMYSTWKRACQRQQEKKAQKQRAVGFCWSVIILLVRNANTDKDLGNIQKFSLSFCQQQGGKQHIYVIK